MSKDSFLQVFSTTLMTFLSFPLQTKRRKPHEAHSAKHQEEVSKPGALWVMQFTYCAGWGFASSLILQHKKNNKKKILHSLVYKEHKKMTKTNLKYTKMKVMMLRKMFIKIKLQKHINNDKLNAATLKMVVELKMSR